MLLFFPVSWLAGRGTSRGGSMQTIMGWRALFYVLQNQGIRKAEDA
jgi:hypothetical protein